jgi:hypothetical protein
MFKQAAVVIGAVGALALSAAPALAGASYTVVPFKSISGIQLKWTPAQVRQHAGKPSAVFHENGKISGYQYAKGYIQVDFDTFDKQDRADLVSANTGPYHTIRGIRIGTTLKTLKHKLRGYDHFSCTAVGCTISDEAASTAPGAGLTGFGVVGGKVNGMDVSYVFSDGA